MPALDGGWTERVDRAVLGQLLEDEHPAFRQLSIGPEGVEHGVDGLVAAFGVDERRPAVDHPADLGDDERVGEAAPAPHPADGHAAVDLAVLLGEDDVDLVAERLVPGGRHEAVRFVQRVRFGRPGGEGRPGGLVVRAQRTNMDYSAVHDVAALPCPHPTVRASRG